MAVNLKAIIDLGVDPVETLPDGDVTYAEAREITGPDMILAGNLQRRELFSKTTSNVTIHTRVRDMVEEAGPEKIILTTTGTPLERIPEEIAKNYNTFIDAAFEYGKIRP